MKNKRDKIIKKFLDIYNKNMILVIISIISLISIFILIIFPYKSNVEVASISGTNLYPSAVIEPNKKYVQTVNCNLNEINKIGLTFSTYYAENKNGTLHVIITDEEDKNIYDNIIPLNDLKDNVKYFFNFENIKDAKNKTFKIEMFYEDFKKNDSLAYWYGNTTTDNGLKINEENTSQVIAFTLTGKNNDYSIIWYPLIILFICLTILSLGDVKAGVIDEK